MSDDRLRVAYLSGSGHSGTTITAFFLDAHPQIASVGEAAPQRYSQVRRGAELPCSCGELYQDCPFWRRIFEEVTRQGITLGPTRWSTDHRYKNQFLHRMFTRYSRYRPVRAFQEVAAEALPWHQSRMARIDRANVLFVRSVLNATGAKVFFDTSKYSSRLYQLLRLPELDVKVVKITRDVRGAVSSAKRRGQSVEWAATTWLNHQRVIADVTKRLPPDRVFSLRYEHLCEDFRYWLQRLYEFLEVDVIEPPRSIKTREHHIMGNPLRKKDELAFRAPDRWQEALTSEEVSRAMQIAGALNERLGYTT